MCPRRPEIPRTRLYRCRERYWQARSRRGGSSQNEHQDSWRSHRLPRKELQQTGKPRTEKQSQDDEANVRIRTRSRSLPQSLQDSSRHQIESLNLKCWCWSPKRILDFIIKKTFSFRETMLGDNCYLAQSDPGEIDYRRLPCYRSCCADPDSDEVCPWRAYTDDHRKGILDVGFTVNQSQFPVFKILRWLQAS